MSSTTVSILSEPSPTQTEWSSSWDDDTPAAADTAEEEEEEDDSSLSHCYAFRSIRESDRDRVKELHEDWFPVV